MNTLAENLKKERKKSGLTLEQVAQRIEKTNGMVSHWETGKHEPSLADLRKLAGLYGTSVSSLIGESAGSFTVDYVRKLEKKIEDLETTLANVMRLVGNLGKSEPVPSTASVTIGLRRKSHSFHNNRGQNRVQAARPAA